MRVVMAYATPFAEAVRELHRWCPVDAELEYVGGDDLAYWRLWNRLWTDGAPFVLVEQDIVIRAETVPILAACHHPWCAFVYHEEVGNPVSGLGCTKFIPSLAIWPNRNLEGLPEPHWANVDATVAGLLQAGGWKVHEHGPWLRHLNPRVAAMQESENHDD